MIDERGAAMTSIQQAEAVLLESGDVSIDEPSQDTFNKVTAELVQVQKWKHSGLRTQILDGKFLRVRKFQYGREIEYWINLLFLQPVSRRQICIDWRWGAATWWLSGVAAGLYTLEHYLHLSSKVSYFESAIIALVTLAVLSLLMTVYKSSFAQVFQTASGHVPILSMAINKPSKGEFRTYVRSLSDCIADVQRQYEQGTKNLLANELAEHRRLKDVKVISQHQYDAAKKQILSRH